jgi:ATP-dependent Lhr-like helicase
VTLELGIDIGGLDRVVQLGAPVSASSFTQRIGRCGRQGQPAELLFLIKSEIEPQPGDPLGCIDWDFIKAIAVVRLYLEERWIAPITPPGQCFSLCHHQTMCLLAAAGELSPARLAQEILTLPAFSRITQEDYRTLLRHLLELGHLRRGDAGGLMLGVAGETIATGYDFLAVFTAPEEWQVTYKDKTIGTVAQACPPGERIALAGRGWEVTRCDEARRRISVKPSQGPAESKWESFPAYRAHARVLEEMRAVLDGEGYDAYLSPESRIALQAMRDAWKAHTPGPIVSPTPDACLLFPWLGTPALQALQLALQDRGISARIMPGAFTPVYLECRATQYALRRALAELRAEGIDADALPLRRGLRAKCKFDPFLPEGLLQKQARDECLDAPGAIEFLRQF